VALVPRASAGGAAALERLPGCLRVRPVFDNWHAVYRGTPAAVHSNLIAALGSNGIRCESVPLEELFIELVGGKRGEGV
jgi:hypothetical protein